MCILCRLGSDPKSSSNFRHESLDLFPFVWAPAGKGKRWLICSMNGRFVMNRTHRGTIVFKIRFLRVCSGLFELFPPHLHHLKIECKNHLFAVPAGGNCPTWTVKVGTCQTTYRRSPFFFGADLSFSLNVKREDGGYNMEKRLFCHGWERERERGREM